MPNIASSPHATCTIPFNTNFGDICQRLAIIAARKLFAPRGKELEKSWGLDAPSEFLSIESFALFTTVKSEFQW